MSTNPYEASQVETSPRPIAQRGWGGFLLQGAAVLLAGGVLIALLLPNVRFAGKAGRRSMCSNNMRQIGLALQNYHDDYGGFPPAYTVDANGKPLHSWRTLILPYLGEKALYNSIDLSRPWNDPVNAMACAFPMQVYQCPGAFRNEKGENLTTYFASVGTDAAIHPTRSRKLSEVTDLRPLLVLEVPINKAVPWMSPQDADETLIKDINADSKHAHPGIMTIVCTDGSVS